LIKLADLPNGPRFGWCLNQRQQKQKKRKHTELRHRPALSFPTNTGTSAAQKDVWLNDAHFALCGLQ
jgi:hypothetical protein